MAAYGALYSDGVALTPKPKKKRRYPERDLVHLPLMCHARKHLPCVKKLLHIANERRTSPQAGAMLKAMGVQPYVSDLFLAVPIRPFGGYWIELKAPGKNITSEQAGFLAEMRALGYAAAWFDDWKKAWDSILDYLAGKLS